MKERNKIFRDYSILGALIIISIILGVVTHGTFFSSRNIINVARQVSVNGILAVGMTLVIIVGGIDLSVGSIVAVTGIIVAMTQWMGTTSSITFTLLCGTLIGLWNGFFITKFKIPPFIATLGMMTIARGVSLVLSGGSAITPLNESFKIIGQGYIPVIPSVIIVGVVLILILFFTIKNIINKKVSIKNWEYVLNKVLIFSGLILLLAVIINYKNGIPVPVAIFVFIALLFNFILNRTKFGRYIYAIGGNSDAARLSGINVNRVILLVFTLMGILSAIAGIVLTSRLDAGVPTAGNMFELDAIASVVIGGTSLTGGYGTIGGTIIGAFIIGVINNGLSLLNVNTYFQYIIKGFIIIGAVMLDVRKKS